MSPTEKQIKVEAKVREVVRMACELLKITMPPVTVKFNLDGIFAGQACQDNWRLSIRFNPLMVEGKSFKYILNHTVPHEVAHLVCFVYPKFGDGHNRGWKRLCIQLGGDGKATHDEDFRFIRGKTYQYTSTNNATIIVSEIVHRRILKGASYTLHHGGGVITNAQPFKILK